MEESEIKKEFKKGGGRGRGKQGFNKKGKPSQKQLSSNADEYFDGYCFCVGKEGPEMYVRTIEKLGLYASTHFKNGLDVKKCLKKIALISNPAPVLPQDPTDSEKMVWEYRMADLLRSERTLQSNLNNMFAILMSLCDSDMKSRVESCSDYAQMDDDLDTLKLLSTIKKLVYSGATHELNVRHNKAMAHMSLMTLCQDRFQDIREFHDQYVAIRRMCDE